MTRVTMTSCVNGLLVHDISTVISQNQASMERADSVCIMSSGQPIDFVSSSMDEFTSDDVPKDLLYTFDNQCESQVNPCNTFMDIDDRMPVTAEIREADILYMASETQESTERDFPNGMNGNQWSPERCQRSFDSYQQPPQYLYHDHQRRIDFDSNAPDEFRYIDERTGRQSDGFHNQDRERNVRFQGQRRSEYDSDFVDTYRGRDRRSGGDQYKGHGYWKSPRGRSSSFSNTYRGHSQYHNRGRNQSRDWKMKERTSSDKFPKMQQKRPMDITNDDRHLEKKRRLDRDRHSKEKEYPSKTTERRTWDDKTKREDNDRICNKSVNKENNVVKSISKFTDGRDRSRSLSCDSISSSASSNGRERHRKSSSREKDIMKTKVSSQDQEYSKKHNRHKVIHRYGSSSRESSTDSRKGSSSSERREKQFSKERQHFKSNSDKSDKQVQQTNDESKSTDLRNNVASQSSISATDMCKIANEKPSDVNSVERTSELDKNLKMSQTSDKSCDLGGSVGQLKPVENNNLTVASSHQHVDEKSRRLSSEKVFCSKSLPEDSNEQNPVHCRNTVPSEIVTHEKSSVKSSLCNPATQQKPEQPRQDLSTQDKVTDLKSLQKKQRHSSGSLTGLDVNCSEGKVPLVRIPKLPNVNKDNIVTKRSDKNIKSMDVKNHHRNSLGNVKNTPNKISAAKSLDKKQRHSSGTMGSSENSSGHCEKALGKTGDKSGSQKSMAPQNINTLPKPKSASKEKHRRHSGNSVSKSSANSKMIVTSKTIMEQTYIDSDLDSSSLSTSNSTMSEKDETLPSLVHKPRRSRVTSELPLSTDEMKAEKTVKPSGLFDIEDSVTLHNNPTGKVGLSSSKETTPQKEPESLKNYCREDAERISVSEKNSKKFSLQEDSEKLSKIVGKELQAKSCQKNRNIKLKERKKLHLSKSNHKGQDSSGCKGQPGKDHKQTVVKNSQGKSEKEKKNKNTFADREKLPSSEINKVPSVSLEKLNEQQYSKDSDNSKSVQNKGTKGTDSSTNAIKIPDISKPVTERMSLFDLFQDTSDDQQRMKPSKQKKTPDKKLSPHNKQKKSEHSKHRLDGSSHKSHHERKKSQDGKHSLVSSDLSGNLKEKIPEDNAHSNKSRVKRKLEESVGDETIKMIKLHDAEVNVNQKADVMNTEHGETECQSEAKLSEPNTQHEGKTNSKDSSQQNLSSSRVLDSSTDSTHLRNSQNSNKEEPDSTSTSFSLSLCMDSPSFRSDEGEIDSTGDKSGDKSLCDSSRKINTSSIPDTRGSYCMFEATSESEDDNENSRLVIDFNSSITTNDDADEGKENTEMSTGCDNDERDNMDIATKVNKTNKVTDSSVSSVSECIPMEKNSEVHNAIDSSTEMDLGLDKTNAMDATIPYGQKSTEEEEIETSVPGITIKQEMITPDTSNGDHIGTKESIDNRSSAQEQNEPISANILGCSKQSTKTLNNKDQCVPQVVVKQEKVSPNSKYVDQTSRLNTVAQMENSESSPVVKSEITDDSNQAIDEASFKVPSANICTQEKKQSDPVNRVVDTSNVMSSPDESENLISSQGEILHDPTNDFEDQDDMKMFTYVGGSIQSPWTPMPPTPYINYSQEEEEKECSALIPNHDVEDTDTGSSPHVSAEERDSKSCNRISESVGSMSQDGDHQNGDNVSHIEDSRPSGIPSSAEEQVGSSKLPDINHGDVESIVPSSRPDSPSYDSGDSMPFNMLSSQPCDYQLGKNLDETDSEQSTKPVSPGNNPLSATMELVNCVSQFQDQIKKVIDVHKENVGSANASEAIVGQKTIPKDMENAKDNSNKTYNISPQLFKTESLSPQQPCESENRQASATSVDLSHDKAASQTRQIRGTSFIRSTSVDQLLQSKSGSMEKLPERSHSVDEVDKNMEDISLTREALLNAIVSEICTETLGNAKSCAQDTTVVSGVDTSQRNRVTYVPNTVTSTGTTNSTITHHSCDEVTVAESFENDLMGAVDSAVTAISNRTSPSTLWRSPEQQQLFNELAVHLNLLSNSKSMDLCLQVQHQKELMDGSKYISKGHFSARHLNDNNKVRCIQCVECSNILSPIEFMCHLCENLWQLQLNNEISLKKSVVFSNEEQSDVHKCARQLLMTLFKLERSRSCTKPQQPDFQSTSSSTSNIASQSVTTSSCDSTSAGSCHSTTARSIYSTVIHSIPSIATDSISSSSNPVTSESSQYSSGNPCAVSSVRSQTTPSWSCNDQNVGSVPGQAPLASSTSQAMNVALFLSQNHQGLGQPSSKASVNERANNHYMSAVCQAPEISSTSVPKTWSKRHGSVPDSQRTHRSHSSTTSSGTLHSGQHTDQWGRTSLPEYFTHQPPNFSYNNQTSQGRQPSTSQRKYCRTIQDKNIGSLQTVPFSSNETMFPAISQSQWQTSSLSVPHTQTQASWNRTPGGLLPSQSSQAKHCGDWINNMGIGGHWATSSDVSLPMGRQTSSDAFPHLGHQMWNLNSSSMPSRSAAQHARQMQPDLPSMSASVGTRPTLGQMGIAGLPSKHNVRPVKETRDCRFSFDVTQSIQNGPQNNSMCNVFQRGISATGPAQQGSTMHHSAVGTQKCTVQQTVTVQQAATIPQMTNVQQTVTNQPNATGQQTASNPPNATIQQTVTNPQNASGQQTATNPQGPTVHQTANNNVQQTATFQQSATAAQGRDSSPKPTSATEASDSSPSSWVRMSDDMLDKIAESIGQKIKREEDAYQMFIVGQIMQRKGMEWLRDALHETKDAMESMAKKHREEMEKRKEYEEALSQKLRALVDSLPGIMELQKKN